jgi:predicted DNA-binding transcriptional regulator YafY
VAKRARNQEVIRQWTLLRDLWEGRYGRTIEELAQLLKMHPRTIRRDIAALQEAGFPLEQRLYDTRRAYTLNKQAFKGLIDAGLTLPELCALYFSRALLEYLAATPFQKDLASAFQKFEGCLTPAQWKYLDEFPKVLAAKAEPRKKAGGEAPTHVSRLIGAALEHRRVAMSYYSFFSKKVKKYVVEPHQVCYAQGGLYLVAFVPAYQEPRLFAIERVKTLTVLDEHFTPGTEPVTAQLANSLGINLSGRPESVVIEFQPDAAPYVLEREWHPSQVIESRADGCVVLRMKVVVDWALTTWVLGFGPRARVVGPRRLAQQIFELLEDTRVLYAPRIPIEAPRTSGRRQRGLPFAQRATGTGK